MNRPSSVASLRRNMASMSTDRITRTVLFADPVSKARWLDAMCTLDARLPVTRRIARSFAAHIDPNDREALARDLHAFVRDSIRYVRDPAGEEFSDSDVILDAGFGDCDDKARLFVALCRSVGLLARILPCFIGGAFVHVQAQVDFGEGWTVAELIVRDIPLGDLPPNGQKVLS